MWGLGWQRWSWCLCWVHDTEFLSRDIYCGDATVLPTIHLYLHKTTLLIPIRLVWALSVGVLSAPECLCEDSSYSTSSHKAPGQKKRGFYLCKAIIFDEGRLFWTIRRNLLQECQFKADFGHPQVPSCIIQYFPLPWPTPPCIYLNNSATPSTCGIQQSPHIQLTYSFPSPHSGGNKVHSFVP